MIKALIIDDEISCRETLEQILGEECPHLKIIGKASSVKEGLQCIEKHKVDLVFLDIEMPLENGFKLFDYLETIDFEVIFTTAYAQYAIRAIKLSALDYLLKPIDADELKLAVSKMNKKEEKNSSFQQIQLLQKNLNQTLESIALPTLDGFLFVQLAEIVRCESSGNYTIFYLKDGTKHMISKPIKEFEELLSDFSFQRVHRSHIVNLNFIRRFQRGKYPKIVTTDGVQISLSLKRKEAFLEKFLNI